MAGACWRELARALAQDGLWAHFRLPRHLFDWSNICIFWAVVGCRDQAHQIWEKLATQASKG